MSQSSSNQENEQREIPTRHSHVLRSCFMEDHEGRTGRITSCIVGAGGIIIFVAGIIGVISATVPKLSFIVLEPDVLLGDVNLFTAIGAIVLGLVLLGRQRIADRAVNTGEDIKHGLGLSTPDESSENGE